MPAYGHFIVVPEMLGLEWIAKWGRESTGSTGGRDSAERAIMHLPVECCQE